MAALIGAIGAACFVRVLQLGFVYDDHWTIVDNRYLDRSLVWLLRTVVAGDPEAAQERLAASVRGIAASVGTTPVPCRRAQTLVNSAPKNRICAE